ncbi:hypothetical protein HY224_00320, partial [Candidatus Uhrbacteria bacterium]|nr:hypothetical protein [Candidatus Uhrbacteria bacterium]
KEQKLLERINKPIADVKEKVSGAIKTPGDFIFHDAIQQAQKEKDSAAIFTGRLAADVINTFVTTLASQYLSKLKTGLHSIKDLVSKDDKSLTSPYGAGGASGGVTQAKETYQKSFVAPIKSINSYSQFQDFSTCPDDIISRGPNNCVMDTGFNEALTAAGEDTYLTIQEAMDKDYLHANWPFGYLNPGGGVEPDVNAGYSYRNMVKLRRARIISLGWEIAAIKIRTLGDKYTLKQVVDSFDDPGGPDENYTAKRIESSTTDTTTAAIVITVSGHRLA